MPTKDAIAAELIHWHFQVEPSLIEVYRITNANESDPSEPIKLVEVNEATVSTGHLDVFGFAATPDVPYPTLIAEVTPGDLERLRKTGGVPTGWDLDLAQRFVRPAA